MPGHGRHTRPLCAGRLAAGARSSLCQPDPRARRLAVGDGGWKDRGGGAAQRGREAAAGAPRGPDRPPRGDDGSLDPARRRTWRSRRARAGSGGLALDPRRSHRPGPARGGRRRGGWLGRNPSLRGLGRPGPPGAAARPIAGSAAVAFAGPRADRRPDRRAAAGDGPGGRGGRPSRVPRPAVPALLRVLRRRLSARAPGAAPSPSSPARRELARRASRTSW